MKTLLKTVLWLLSPMLLLAQTPGTVKWTFNIGNDYGSSPAIGADGTIYVGSDKLYAVNPNGTQRWAFRPYQTNDYILTTSIGSDGTIYAGSTDKKLYAINPNGTLKWEFMTGADVRNLAVFGQDGAIYVSSYDNKFYAINPDGTLRWSFTTGDKIWSSAAIGLDGIIYLPSEDNNLYAINPDGTLKWSFATDGDFINASPAIGSDGTIYLGSRDEQPYQYLYAFNPDGTLKWKTFFSDYYIHASVAIAVDETIYAPGMGGLIAMNPNGTVRWAFLVGAWDGIWNSPAIGSDGTVYFGCDNGNLYAVNPDGKQRWSFFNGKSLISSDSSPVIGADGTVYFTCNTGKLYAIYGDNRGLADSAWPMFGGNVRHTGQPNPRLRLEVPNGGETFITGSICPISWGSNCAIDHVRLEYSDDAGLNWQTIANSVPNDGVFQWTVPAAPCDNYLVRVSTPDGGIADQSNSVFATRARGNPGTLKWSFTTKDWIGNSSPAIADDGTLYIGSWDQRLYALNSFHTLKWSLVISSSLNVSSPAIGEDGTVYICADSSLHAVSPQGSLKWSYRAGDLVWSTPAIGEDGIIYFGSDDNRLNAIYPDGTRKWFFSAGNDVNNPSIAADGTIYVGSDDKKIHAINPNGTLKWSFATQYVIDSSPAIAKDGAIYVGGDWNKKVYALNPDGTQKWVFTTGDYAGSPIIGPDGTVYVGSVDHKLYAINRDGTQKWAVEIGGPISSTPAIGDDGLIYVGSSEGKVYAFNTEGIVQWSYASGGPVRSSPAIGPDGTVIVGSDDNKVHIIYASSSHLAKSSWPKYQADNKNTGRQIKINQPPVITSPSNATATEDILFTYAATATDPESTPLAFLFTHYPSWLTPGGSTLSGTPREGARDTSFVVIASDGELADTLFVIVDVLPVNDPPAITSPSHATATEDILYTYTATATDPENSPLVFLFTHYPSWLTPGGSKLSGIPREGAKDTSFVVIASDGELADTLMVIVDVLPVNDPPVITSADTVSAMEHEPFQYIARATDPEKDNITFIFSKYPVWLAARDSVIAGVPGEGARDTTFTVIASDGSLRDTLAVGLSVRSVNDPPVITSPASVKATEKKPFEYKATASDPEGDSLSFAFSAYPDWLVPDTRRICGIPPEGAKDTDFMVIASDGELADTLRVFAEVIPINDPPRLISPDSVYAYEDTPFLYAARATDPENSPLGFSFMHYPHWLIPGDSTIAGTPLEGMQDTSFVVIASDGGLEDTLNVLITVMPVNDPPEIINIIDFSFCSIDTATFALDSCAIDPDDAVQSLYWNISALDTNLLVNLQDRTVRFSVPRQWHGTVEVKFKVVDTKGGADSIFVEAVVIMPSVVEQGLQEIPVSYCLAANYPNPFNPQTTIMFGLPKTAEVSIKIFNINGQLVEELLHGKISAGYHELKWHAVNCPAGLYFIILQTPDSVYAKKCILMK